MDNVVYVLGAGFSAPLGLPVTSNFMEAAQDMYIAEPARYGHFREIFEFARSFGAIKNYVSSDQLNIEEILSILEMQSDAKERPERQRFVDFLCDVVRFYMPEWRPIAVPELPIAWPYAMWGNDDGAELYGRFVGSLLGLELSGHPVGGGALRVEGYGRGTARYCVISFNYDRVLETLCENASTVLGQPGVVAFRTVGDGTPEVFSEQPLLVKLHGDAKARDVVPPTWSKGASENILPAWSRAFQALRQATRIRFVGYSLPTADEYFKYLVKAAFTSGIYRKEIDVVCLDPEGSVSRRYHEFFPTRLLRFTSLDVTTYLAHVRSYAEAAVTGPYTYGRLEESHMATLRDAVLA